jgi:hypothetical protein
MGRGHEHHVEEVGQLAEGALTPFAAEGLGRLVRFLDELCGDGRSAAREELRGERSLGQLAAALPKERHEL